MIIIKIITEFVLGMILLALGAGFWACVKSPSFIADILSNRKAIERYINKIGIIKIIEDSKEIKPIVDSYSYNMIMLLKEGIGSLDQARNMNLIIGLIIIGGSYFLGLTFLLINIVIFLLTAGFPLPASAQNNAFSDVYSLILNVYKWNNDSPEECKNFCLNEQYRLLKNIYIVVLDLSGKKV